MGSLRITPIRRLAPRESSCYWLSTEEGVGKKLQRNYQHIRFTFCPLTTLYILSFGPIQLHKQFIFLRHLVFPLPFKSIYGVRQPPIFILIFLLAHFLPPRPESLPFLLPGRLLFANFGERLIECLKLCFDRRDCFCWLRLRLRGRRRPCLPLRSWAWLWGLLRRQRWGWGLLRVG